MNAVPVDRTIVSLVLVSDCLPVEAWQKALSFGWSELILYIYS